MNMRWNELLRWAQAPAHATRVVAGSALALVGISFIVKYGFGYEPCPLCIVQRTLYLLLGLVGLGATFLARSRRGYAVFGALALCLAIIGLGVAAYHVHLQAFSPPLTTSCGPGAEYLLDSMPLTEAFPLFFRADGDCTDSSFRILGLTMPQLSVMAFLGFSLYLANMLAALFVVRKSND
jgi:protein dithiol:quinone oxidoreductase